MSIVGKPFVEFIEARSFRGSVFVSGVLICGTIVIVATVLCLGYLCMCNCCIVPLKRRRRRMMQEKRRSSRRATAYGLDSINGEKDRLLGEEEETLPASPRGIDELEEEQELEARERKACTDRKWNVLALWGWAFIITTGALPLWSVTMDYLYIWIGVAISLTYYWVAWFLFFPFGPTSWACCRMRGKRNQRSITEKRFVLQDGDDDTTAEQREDTETLRRCCSSPTACAGATGRFLWRGLFAGLRRGRKRPIIFAIGFFLFLVIVLLFAVSWEGLCIAEYPFHLSTRMTRRFDSSTCDGPAPCHVYLTLGPHVDSTMYVHWHYTVHGYDHSQKPESIVYYDIVSHKDKQSNVSLADSYRYSASGAFIEWETRDTTRILHMALMENLQPDTVYYFRTGYGADPNRFSEEKQFISGPASADSRYSFVNGGDLGLSTATKIFSKLAASLSPRFALLGGDIAYANAMESCYMRWDDWLDEWEHTMVTPEGNYIPMATAIGNHESGGRVPFINPHHVPFYYHFFTPAIMMTKNNRLDRRTEEKAEAPMGDNVNSVKAVGDERLASIGEEDQRRTYWEYWIGDRTLIIALDSGMATPVTGKQAEWLEATLQEFWQRVGKLPPSEFKPRVILFYHVPMWPTDRYQGGLTAVLQDGWSGIFEKYNVSVALEHHSHRYGRTFMLGREHNSNGTLHIGGGGWGVPASTNKCDFSLTGCKSGNPWYMDEVYIKQHILHVHVRPDSVNVTALDIHGTLFDSVVKPL